MTNVEQAQQTLPYFSPAAATRRFLADTAREIAAINAIGTYVAAAGYTCSNIRGWNHGEADELECVCDLYIDDIRLGDMAITVAFAENDRVTGIAGSFGHLLDLRTLPSA